jgi:hypothetical protein
MRGNRNRKPGAKQNRTTLHYGKLVQGSSSDPTVSRLRQQFLDKITEANPGIAATLWQLLAKYRNAKDALVFEQPAGHSVSGRLGWFTAAFTGASAPEAQELKAAILGWATCHHLEYEWIWDVALKTLDFWDRQAKMGGGETAIADLPRLIMPSTDVRNRGELERFFNYRAEFTHEEGESISSYRKRLMEAIHRALDAHIAQITTSADHLHPATWERDIGWLAEYHQGHRALTIALKVGINERSITRAIAQVGKLIGISIPRGRRPKKRRGK